MSGIFERRSPSRVFYAIGSDIVAGLVNGINENSSKAAAATSKAAQAAIDAAQARLDKAVSKNSGDSIKSATGELGKSKVEYETLKNYELFQIRVEADGVEKAHKSLESLINLRLELGKDLKIPLPQNSKDIEAEVERLTKYQEGVKDVRKAYESLIEQFTPAKTEFEKINELFSNTEWVEGYAKSIGKTADEVARLAKNLAMQQALARMQAEDKVFDAMGGGRGRNGGEERTGEPIGKGISAPKTAVPDDDIEPPKFRDLTFFEKLKSKLEGIQKTLPSIKDAMSDIFISLPQKAGDILSNALKNWDGSFQGFFKSVAKGFGELITELINQLLRMIVVQAIMSAIKATFGKGEGGWFSRFSTDFSEGLGMNKSGIKVPNSNSISGSFGSIPRTSAATGAYLAAGQPALVGEHGWEMFIPGTNGTVVNQEQLLAKLGNARGQTINNININASRSDSLATPKSRRQTAEAMTSALRRYNG